MKNVWKESWALVFKRGNIWALAIGVLVGGAFGAVVNALANDIIMQAIAKTAGVKGIDSLVWGATQWNTDPVTHLNTTPIDGIKYGKFLSALIAMFIMIFFLVFCTFIALLIWRSIKKRKDAKKALLPAETVVMQPTTEELILEELRKLNASNSTKAVKAVSVAKPAAAKPAAKKATVKPAAKKSK